MKQPRTMADILAALKAPFPPEEVEWRVGSTNRRKWEQGKPKRGLPLCYHDARMVMERLDEVLPNGDWQAEPLPMHNGTFCCRIGIRNPETGEWVWRGDGAGATGNTADEDKREMAQKGGFSDAFKRAGVMWGIARYLYTIKAEWIVLDDYWGIPDATYKSLERLLRGEKAQPKADTRAPYSKLEGQLRACKSLRALGTLWKNSQDMILSWDAGWQQSITEEKDRCKAKLEEAAEALV
jgi:hypothetical protein